MDWTVSITSWRRTISVDLPNSKYIFPPFGVCGACAVLLCLTACGCGIQIQGTASNSPPTNQVTNNTTEMGDDNLSNLSGNRTEANEEGHPTANSSEEAAIAAAAKERALLLAKRAEMPLVDITFDDLKLEIGEDVKFEPEMLTERVKELEGRKIRIRGYISGTVFQTEGITNFPLMRDTICKFGPGAQAHHNVQVVMTSGNSTKYTTLPITVEGILSVDPFDGPDGLTYSIYKLVGHRTN